MRSMVEGARDAEPARNFQPYGDRALSTALRAFPSPDGRGDAAASSRWRSLKFTRRSSPPPQGEGDPAQHGGGGS